MRRILSNKHNSLLLEGYPRNAYRRHRHRRRRRRPDPLWFAVAEMTAAAELTGSQVVTIERSDDGELYAALPIVLDPAVTPRGRPFSYTARRRRGSLGLRDQWSGALKGTPRSPGDRHRGGV